MTDFATHRQTIIGQQRANIVIAMLVSDSQWFAVTPLPDDVWEIKVKAENRGLLQRIALTADQVVSAGLPGVTGHTEG